MLLKVVRRLCQHVLSLTPKRSSVLYSSSTLGAVRYISEGIRLVGVTFLKFGHWNVALNSGAYFQQMWIVKTETAVTTCLTLCSRPKNSFCRLFPLSYDRSCFQTVVSLLDYLYFWYLRRSERLGVSLLHDQDEARLGRVSLLITGFTFFFLA